MLGFVSAEPPKSPVGDTVLAPSSQKAATGKSNTNKRAINIFTEFTLLEIEKLITIKE